MSLHDLARHHGLTLDYELPGGGWRPVPDETIRLILRGLGQDPDGPATGAPAPVAMEVPADGRCYLPDGLREAPGWGVFCQLYELRSARNWGIGDFADLAALAGTVGAAGGDFLGINPVHALFGAAPSHTSPFSPSNRRFLNPLYVAPDLVGCPRPTIEDGPLVDYPSVAETKRRALRAAFDAREPDPAFDAFVAEGGEPLRLHALFETISAAQGGTGWLAWPEPLRDPRGAAVAELARAHADDVAFETWLQYLARTQLHAAQAACLDAGMRLGLYLDLAVGEAQDGSATWSGAAAALPGLDVGAPPDMFSEQGQNWQLAAPSPAALAAQDFAPFRDMIAAQLRDAGALRIDHAMALWQLFLIPQGRPASDGTHLRFPFPDMLRTLAAESNANEAVVIGEDLGFVPEGFSDAMREANVLSYRILYFEQDPHGFRPTSAYPADGAGLPVDPRPAGARELVARRRHRTARGARHGLARRHRAAPRAPRQGAPRPRAGTRPRRRRGRARAARRGARRGARLRRGDALGAGRGAARGPRGPARSDQPPGRDRRLPELAPAQPDRHRRHRRAPRLRARDDADALHPTEARMILPSATYRLQLREGMDLARAATIVPYLARLGVSHLYLSPIFTAAPGSTHGYDVTDPNEVDPAIGGRAALDGLSTVLKEHGLGLVLDIVPNHMAFTVANPWLRDVLARGEASAWRRHFDIDHDRPLPLPWLGAPFADMADAGEIAVEGREMVAGDLRIPLAVPATGDLHATHEAQPWRLTHWRTEAAAIAHRRFFTVTGLIGLRVEDPAVFEDVHRLTFELVDAGIADGLRVDHVDGLADPSDYLERLRARLPDVPIWVEKILTGDEALPDWPIEGTTGYEAARAIAQVLTDADGAERLADDAPDFRRTVARAKDQIIRRELPAELDRLTDLAVEAAAGDRRAREWGRSAWRDAIRLYIGAFPRYRTYTTADAIPDEDARIVAQTAVAAAEAEPDAGALPDLARLLVDPAQHALRLRLQQVTGAAIAKAQEDTAFYRHTALLSANEVGGEPDEPAMRRRAFHAAMRRRHATMPHALTLTSSHDTKRAEDARMRLAALSHRPQARESLLALTGLRAPWNWYLAQSAFAAAPDGDLEERLPAHMEKAMREAKRDTFWTDPDPEFEGRVTAAARAIAGRIDPLPDRLLALAALAGRLCIAQCALKLTVPGIPDIYQGTEVGSFRLTDPDNRAAIDFDRLARALDDPSILQPFDAVKLSLTRTLLALRRDRPEVFAAPYAPQEATFGILSFTRGPLGVTVTTDGEILVPEPCLWPPVELGPQPVRITLDEG